MQTRNPFFSIVIPTRNRADTLKYTIKTILNQDFQDYEIIICNNNSVDDTEEIVKKFSDKRIKYLKSNIDLSMSDNWELAYTKVTGLYITYIADNEGFIDGALAFMYDLFRLNNYPDIIRLLKNTYLWPCIDSINPNTLNLYFLNEFEIYNSSDIIKEVLEGRKHIKYLPMIYNSFISNEKIRSFISKTGRLFHSAIPDVSTGFSFALMTDSYLSLSYGITCGAYSAKSNGHNFMIKKETDISKDFKKLIAASDINFHSNMPFVKSLTSSIVESYLKVQEALKSTKFDLDFKQVYINIIKEVVIYDDEELDETKAKILESSKFNSELHTFVIEFLEKNPLKIKPYSEIKTKKGFNKHAKVLSLDGKDFNLNNIEQVCKFMGKFYSYSLNDISFPMISKSNLNLIEKSSKIAIWGNGSFSKKLQDLLFQNREDIEICFIIDSFKEDKSNKIPILLPESTDFTDIDYLIIASSFLNDFKEKLISICSNRIKIFKYIIE